MFDFHTHILPGMDDGSRNVEESLALVKELTHQGASGIAATPHFYAGRETPAKFFDRRQTSWELLKPHIINSVDIRLGAELQYFEGIHHYDNLEQFCIEETNLLLIEMPLCTWSNRMVSAVLEINAREDIVVLLAHIERYLPYRNEKVLKLLREQGVLMQVSTGFFTEKRWTAMRMLRKGYIHLLGSDSHNMDSRKPNLSQAIEAITRMNGMALLQKLEENEKMVL